MKKIIILIPCFNEEKGIGKVIDNIPVKTLLKRGYKAKIVVIDNLSTDGTAKIAREKGALVITENKKGKGYAFRKGFGLIDNDCLYVIMLDGDNSYKGDEILRLLEPLESNFADVVIGSRLSGKYKKSSFTTINRLANWAFTFLVRHFYRANITDALSGYYAWKKDVINTIYPDLSSGGFSIEIEMIVKMKKLGFFLTSVPITYSQREGKSKLRQLEDGTIILLMFLKNLTWKPKKS